MLSQKNLTEAALQNMTATMSPAEIAQQIQHLGPEYLNFLMPVIFEPGAVVNVSFGLKNHENRTLTLGWYAQTVRRDMEQVYNKMMSLHGIASNISYANSSDLARVADSEKELNQSLQAVAKHKGLVAQRKLMYAIHITKMFGQGAMIQAVEDAMAKIKTYDTRARKSLSLWKRSDRSLIHRPHHLQQKRGVGREILGEKGMKIYNLTEGSNRQKKKMQSIFCRPPSNLPHRIELKSQYYHCCPMFRHCFLPSSRCRNDSRGGYGKGNYVPYLK